MKARISLKCDNCGSRFDVGNKNGIPNGITLVQQDNTRITLCRECIMLIGDMSDSEKDEFFAKLKSKAESEVTKNE